MRTGVFGRDGFYHPSSPISVCGVCHSGDVYAGINLYLLECAHYQRLLWRPNRVPNNKQYSASLGCIGAREKLFAYVYINLPGHSGSSSLTQVRYLACLMCVCRVFFSNANNFDRILTRTYFDQLTYWSGVKRLLALLVTADIVGHHNVGAVRRENSPKNEKDIKLTEKGSSDHN